MKLKDFDFRIYNENHKGCGNKDCKCQSKYILGEHAKNMLSEFMGKDVEIELWTGLRDRNGKKIYENDIITLCHFAQKWIGVVRFGRNGFVITSKDENAEQGGELSYFEKYFYDFEVIGNIHENPELLKN